MLLLLHTHSQHTYIHMYIYIHTYIYICRHEVGHLNFELLYINPSNYYILLLYIVSYNYSKAVFFIVIKWFKPT